MEGAEQRNCPGCGKFFYPGDLRQQYCSKSCYRHYYNKNRKITANCQTCGKEFAARNNKIYCSDYCRPGSKYKGEMSEEQAKTLLNNIVLNYFAGGDLKLKEIIMRDLATKSSKRVTIGELIGEGRKPFWPRKAWLNA